MRNTIRVLSLIFILLLVSTSYVQSANSTEVTVPPTPAYAHIKTQNGTLDAKNYNSILSLIGIGNLTISEHNGTIIFSVNGSLGSTGINSINSDTSHVQTIQGSGNNVTVSSFNGTTIINLGNNAALKDRNNDFQNNNLILGSTIYRNGSGFTTTLKSAEVISNKTIYLPNPISTIDTLAGVGETNLWTGSNTFSTLKLGGDESAQNHKITLLKTPTITTDAQNAGHIGLNLISIGTCIDGQAYVFQGSNSTMICKTVLTKNTKLEFSSTTPSISSCGTSPSITGNDNVGKAVIGSGIVTNCIITFATSWTNTPACMANDESNILMIQTITTTTTLTFNATTSISGNVIKYICMGYS